MDAEERMHKSSEEKKACKEEAADVPPLNAVGTSVSRQATQETVGDVHVIVQEIESGMPTLVAPSLVQLELGGQIPKSEQDGMVVPDEPTQSKNGEVVVLEPGPIPDGGYGWVIVVLQFVSQAATWGMMTVYGVFLSWFQEHHTFGNEPPVSFGWIAGTAISTGFLFSPLTAYVCKLLPLRVTLAIAQTILALGFILAGQSKTVWQFALTQGVMCGLGIGLNFMATQPLISQWFLRRRALAMGLSSGGVGAGGLIFSFTTRMALAAHGVRIAYLINGLVVFVMLTPTTLLFRPRMRVLHPRFKPVRPGLWKKFPGLIFIGLWSFFIMLGYLIPLLTIATYSTQAVGLSQAQGASIQAMLAAGQLIGRPGLGLALDRFGRIYMASVVSFLSGLTCLVIWMLARSQAVLLVFGLLNGILSGIFFSALGPLLSEVVPLQVFSDSLSLIWLVTAPISLVAPAIAFALIGYSSAHQPEGMQQHNPGVYHVTIGVAGGANVLAGLVLLGARRYQRKEQDR
ncbi:Probable transporter MCH2 [Serendipita indica DSM 11827]|uniref:Related to ESBP6-similarity to monocarboxylate transporter n=1 Tax=Serendipita indica (strain DSM 11827) TaxID=1109443 RepID=G4T6C1_SERID|nr:Probable transporter MCH2 [Serendipita indica DSM 11827]CCA66850.1 related to ESBP6-similarity to monocarboxylate transporter [Serendipita indica DSM 11827]